MMSDRLLVLENLFKDCCEIIDNSTGRIEILQHYGMYTNKSNYMPMNRDLKRERHRVIKHKLIAILTLDRIQIEKEKVKMINKTYN